MRKMSYNESLDFCKKILEHNSELIKGYYHIHQLSKTYGSSVEYKGNFRLFFEIFNKCKINHEDILNIIDNLSVDLAYGYCCASTIHEYPFISKKCLIYRYLNGISSNSAFINQLNFNNSEEALYRKYFHKAFSKVIEDEDYVYDLLFNKFEFMINTKLSLYDYNKYNNIHSKIANYKLYSHFSINDFIGLLMYYNFPINIVNNTLNQYFNLFTNKFYIPSYELQEYINQICLDLIHSHKNIAIRKFNNDNNFIMNYEDLIDLLTSHIDEIYNRYGQKFFKKCKRGHILYILYFIYFQNYFNDDMFNVLLTKLSMFAKNESYKFKNIYYYLNSKACNISEYYLNKLNAMRLITELH